MITLIQSNSPIVRRLVKLSESYTSDPIPAAQYASMMGLASLSIVDSYGFLKQLHTLAAFKARGAALIVVLDTWDIRGLCAQLNIPCLEPWDAGSLKVAVNEALDYSGVSGRPYVIRLNPMLSGELNNALKDVEAGGSATFNRNWFRERSWWFNAARVEEAREGLLKVSGRAGVFVEAGENLVEGFLASYIKVDNAARTLYINPLPYDKLRGVKRVFEHGRYLSSSLAGMGIGVEAVDASGAYHALLRDVARAINAGPVDPYALIKLCIAKLASGGEMGNAPVILATPYVASIVQGSSAVDYGPGPIYFRAGSIDEVFDVVHWGIGDVGVSQVPYIYGNVILVADSCNPPKSSSPALVLVVDECEPPQGVEVVEVNLPVGLDEVCQVVRRVARGESLWVKVRQARGLRVSVDYSRCDLCGDCLLLGCEALRRGEKGYPEIDPSLCIGCGACVSACLRSAIRLGENK